MLSPCADDLLAGDSAGTAEVIAEGSKHWISLYVCVGTMLVGPVRNIIGFSLRLHWQAALLITLSLLGNSVGVTADTPPIISPALDSLADAISVAAKKFRPITAAEIESARVEALRGLNSLEQFLTSAAPKKLEGWQLFLDLNGLREELDGVEVPNLQRIARNYNRLTSGEPGLELKPFRNAAEAMRPLLERLQLRESDPARNAEAQQRFTQAIDHLEQFLKTGAPEKEKGWKEFLRWDDLRELASETSVDAREAGKLLALFEGEQSGLERSEFRRVARTLRKRIELSQLTRQTSGAERFQKRMEQLVEALKSHREAPTNDSLATINSTLLWLHQIGQYPEIIGMFRHQFNRPNIYLGISDRFIAQQLGDIIERCEPVVRCFEGSTIRACANTCGDVSAVLMPCDNGAMIQLIFRGTIYSRGVAQKRRVYVGNSNQTEICGVKNLFLMESGICDCPACANANTISQTCGICVDRNFGRRLIARGANRKANESRCRAQDFASNDACCNLRQRMDKEAMENLAKTNPQLAKLRQQLRDYEVYPDSVHIFSTTTDIHIHSKSLSRMGLSALTAPPAAVPSGDLVVQAHQSIVNDVLTERLGGLKIDNQTIVTLLEKYKIPVPEELKKGSKVSMKNGEAVQGAQAPEGNDEESDSDEAWSMTFDRDLPATVTFDEGMIRIGVRGRKFARADQVINERINISAAYRIVREPNGDVSLVREGEVLVEFVGGRERLSTRQLSYKVFLERKFGAMFQAKISKDQLPKSEATERLDQFTVDSVDATNGWFLAGVSAKGKLQQE
jgi:hypothetical protein